MDGMFDFTPIIQSLIVLIAVFITSYVVPVLKKKMSNSDFELLTMIVEQAVLAAEQIINGTKKGAEKNEYVLNYVLETLESKNITFNLDDVNIAIEAAVKKMNEALKSDENNV